MPREIVVEITVYVRGSEAVDLAGPIHLTFATEDDRPLKGLAEGIVDITKQFFSSLD
ncbi:MAG: hypothetical protein ACE5IJ_11150 [Thermoplasmata archaeon]